MGRSYDPEVYPRVPTNCIEDVRHVCLSIHRFDEPGLCDDEQENCDV